MGISLLTYAFQSVHSEIYADIARQKKETTSGQQTANSDNRMDEYIRQNNQYQEDLIETVLSCTPFARKSCLIIRDFCCFNDQRMASASIIRLEEYARQKRQSRRDLIRTLSSCSPITEEGICVIIMEFCCLDDHILIPNDLTDFKYWDIVPSGSLINPFRDVHNVKLRKSKHLTLIRRGAIASRIGYSPSIDAKLIIECQFRFCNSSDFLTFTTRSDGERSETHFYAQFGIVEEGNCAIRVVQNYWGSARICIGDGQPASFPGKEIMWIPNPLPNELT